MCFPERPTGPDAGNGTSVYAGTRRLPLASRTGNDGLGIEKTLARSQIGHVDHRARNDAASAAVRHLATSRSRHLGDAAGTTAAVVDVDADADAGVVGPIPSSHVMIGDFDLCSKRGLSIHFGLAAELRWLDYQDYLTRNFSCAD